MVSDMTTHYATDTTITPSLPGGDGRLLVAEAVLPGHPDKLADQIADGVLDIALAADSEAIVQIEVAVHDGNCFVSGRCSTAGGPLPKEDVERTVRAVYERAGFGVPFTDTGEGADWQCPRGDDVALSLSVQLDEADPLETAEREYADDQAIHIGYAVATPETRFLPLEQHLALALRQRLLELCATRRELGAGPDGKLVVTLLPTGDDAPRFAVRQVIVSLQHLDRAPLVLLQRAVREVIVGELRAQHASMPRLLAEPDVRLPIRFNESVDFVRGGPMNDNGQTGRKLVCDFYGPRVPLGGGALSGKDPWRLDRAGAFRARQLALAIVDTGFVSDALVAFAWAPRDQRPSYVEILVDGRSLSMPDVARWLRRYDPSLRATWEELALSTVNYENCARAGHFGRGMPWEREVFGG
jgi:S-adenosylmethionine synthetase